MKSIHRVDWMPGCRIALAVLFGMSSMLAPLRFAWAHEGHAALPSTGAAIDGNQLLLSPDAIEAIRMETAKVSLGDIHQVLRVNARVELPAQQRARVATLLEGRIASVLVRPGEKVNAGQELARIESIELESLQYDLLEAAVQLDLLERLIAERETLAERGAIAGSLLLETRRDLGEQQAELEIIRLKLTGWGLSTVEIDRVLETQELLRTVAVTSPIYGVVEQVDARRGQLVQATDHLFDIVDSSRLYVVGEVVESDAHLVSEGMDVSVNFRGLRVGEYDGTIDHLHLHVHEPDRTLHVVALVENVRHELRPGMPGTMHIQVASAMQEIVCPTSAVINRPDGTFVLRREAEGKFSLRPVTLGMRSRDRVVVTSGLFPGQEVISSGTHLLASMFDAAMLPVPDVSDSQQQQVTTAAQTPSENTETVPVRAAAAVVELPTDRRAFATSFIEGRVEEVLVSPGDLVEAGQELARVRSQPLRDLQLQMLQAGVQLAWTEQDVDLLTPLAESGAVAGKELWQREAERQTLRHRIDGLVRQLSILGLPDEQINQLRQRALATETEAPEMDRESGLFDVISIRAPIAGRIAETLLMPGELVHSHDQLFEIQNTQTMWVQALLFEQDAVLMAQGQQAVLTFPASPGLRMTGEVVRVAPTLATQEHTLPVWIEVENSDGFLKDGMFARVTIFANRQSTDVAVRGKGTAGP